jgi:hypothetical protein
MLTLTLLSYCTANSATFDKAEFVHLERSGRFALFTFTVFYSHVGTTVLCSG